MTSTHPAPLGQETDRPGPSRVPPELFAGELGASLAVTRREWHALLHCQGECCLLPLADCIGGDTRLAIGLPLATLVLFPAHADGCGVRSAG